MRVRAIFSFLVLFIFIFPIFGLLDFSQGTSASFENLSDSFWLALSNSFLQSILVCALGFVFAIPLAVSLSCFKARQLPFVEVAMLLPTLIPSLAVILLTFAIVNPFPFGLWGVVCIQLWIHLGLVAVLLQRFWREHWGQLHELAIVLNLPISLEARLVFRNHWRTLAQLILPVFVNVWTSFAVTLMASGGRSDNLEIFIFQNVRQGQGTHFLFLACCLQIVFFFLISLQAKQFQFRRKNLQNYLPEVSFLKWSWIVFLYLGYPFLVFGFWLVQGAFTLFHQQKSMLGLGQAFLSTLFLGFAVATLGYWILAGLLRFAKEKAFEKFLFRSIGLSVGVVGLFLWRSGLSSFPWLAFLYGYLVMQLPVVLKFGTLNSLAAIQHQLDLARVYFPQNHFIFKKIVWPQVRPQALKAAGLLGFWSTGEFALSKYLFNSDSTLAMQAQSLGETFRLHLAFGVLALQLLVGCGVLGFFLWRSNVHRERLFYS